MINWQTSFVTFKQFVLLRWKFRECVWISHGWRTCVATLREGIAKEVTVAKLRGKMLWVELCPSRIQVSKSYPHPPQPLTPQGMTLFGHGVIADTVKMNSYWRKVGPSSNVSGVLIKYLDTWIHLHRGKRIQIAREKMASIRQGERPWRGRSVSLRKEQILLIVDF